MQPIRHIHLDQNNCSGHHMDGVNKVVHSRLTEFHKKADIGEYSLKLSLSGVENYRIDGQEYRLMPGTAILVGPGSRLSVDVRSHETVEGLCIYPDKNLVDQFITQYTKHDGVLLDDPTLTQSADVVPERLRLTETPFGKWLEQNAQRLTGACSSEDIQELAMGIATQVHGAWSTDMGVAKKSTTQELLRRVRVAKYIMQDEYDRDMDMDGLATRCGMSLFHFIRSFKSIEGLSPNKYLQRYRMEKAREFILYTDSPIAEIGVQVGWRDASSFGRTFKKLYGCTPKSLRKGI